MLSVDRQITSYIEQTHVGRRTSNFFAETYKISEVVGYDKRELSHKIMLYISVNTVAVSYILSPHRTPQNYRTEKLPPLSRPASTTVFTTVIIEGTSRVRTTS